MSAPERFQVGDTVRCVDPGHGYSHLLTYGKWYEVIDAEDNTGLVGVEGDRGLCYVPSFQFVLVSRPTPPALDPFAWDALALHEELVDVPGSYVDNIVAWSRFCYWAAQSNLAAHFLPTEAAARTRASNGRDVPPAYMDVRLPVDCAKDWASLDPTNPLWYRSVPPTIEACRRALGAS